MNSNAHVDYHPKLSVFMPVYNGEKYLQQAIDSVLAQIYTNFEFIVIDDGSTDGSIDILNSYHDNRIKLIQHSKNLGIAISSNHGLLLSLGEYIAPMDQDDICVPERFMVQVQFLEKNLTIDIVGSWYEIIDQNGDTRGEIVEKLSLPMGLRWETFFYVPVLNPTVMMRRRILKFGGQYDTSVKIAADYGLWTNINLNVHFSNIQRPLLKYRIHEGNITKTRIDCMYAEHYRISQKTISSYLGKNIPIEFIKFIEMPHKAKSCAENLGSICILRKLYKKFRKEQFLDPSENVYIKLDYANKLSQISHKNYQFISSWFLRIYSITLVVSALLYDLINNNHREVDRTVERVKKEILNLLKPINMQE